MGFHTFGPLLVIDSVTLAPSPGVVGTVVDATTETTVATYNMSGTPVSLITNARGYIGQFQAPDTSVMLRLTFGDLALDVVAKEAIASGGGVAGVSSVDGQTGAVSLSSTYVPLTRTINGQPLSADVTIEAGDGGPVYVGPTQPSVATGVEYVWFKTDGAGTTLDILSGVGSGAGPTPGTHLFTDDFNRATLGADWSPASTEPDLVIVENQAAGAGDNASYSMVTSVSAASSDMYAQAVVTAVSASPSAGVTARAKPAPGATGYLWRYNGTNCQLMRYSGSAYTAIGAAYSATLTLPFVLRVEVQGSTITGYIDGVQRAQVTDATYTSGIRAGMRIAGSESRMDDFAFGDI